MSAEEKYLREVLGLQCIMVPEGHKNNYPDHFDVYGDFSSPVAIVSAQPLDQNQRELAQKMLKAVGVDQLLTIEFKSTASEEDWAEFANAYSGKALWVCGKKPSFISEVKLPKVELPALSELTDQRNPEKLMNLKKKVWAELQSFHKEVLV